jgi:hypothetical protein
MNELLSLRSRVSRFVKFGGEGFAFSKVSRPVWTIESATSIQGIRPEYVALVYPYVTFCPNQSQPRRVVTTYRHELETELAGVEQSSQRLIDVS